MCLWVHFESCLCVHVFHTYLLFKQHYLCDFSKSFSRGRKIESSQQPNLWHLSTSSSSWCVCVRMSVCLSERQRKEMCWFWCMVFLSTLFHSWINVWCWRCWCEVLGAGVCVCTSVAGKKECERGERQAVCTAPKQTSLLFIKRYHVLYLFWKSTCSSKWVLETEYIFIDLRLSNMSVLVVIKQKPSPLLQ